MLDVWWAGQQGGEQECQGEPHPRRVVHHRGGAKEVHQGNNIHFYRIKGGGGIKDGKNTF